MSVSQHDWSLHRKGQIDQERHKEKIREAIKKNLSDIVSEEGIILSDGKKMVRVPIRSLDEYRFRYDPGRQQHAGEGNGKSKVGDVIAQEPRPGKGKKGDAGKEAGYDYYEAEITMEELAAMIFEDLGLPNLEQKRQQELQTEAVRFTDVRKKGPLTNLDKKRTIMENMKRNAAKGDAKIIIKALGLRGVRSGKIGTGPCVARVLEEFPAAEHGRQRNLVAKFHHDQSRQPIGGIMQASPHRHFQLIEHGNRQLMQQRRRELIQQVSVVDDSHRRPWLPAKPLGKFHTVRHPIGKSDATDSVARYSTRGGTSAKTVR